MDNVLIAVTATGGLAGVGVWLLKFLVERSVRQVDKSIDGLSDRFDRSMDRLQALAERVAVMAAAVEKVQTDVNAAHNKIRTLERMGD